MDRWGSCADLLKNRRLLGCCCNLVKKMEFNLLDSQNLLTEVLFDPVQQWLACSFPHCLPIVGWVSIHNYLLFEKGVEKMNEGVRPSLILFLPFSRNM